MSHYYLDSSALVKRYIVEQGTEWINSLALANTGHTLLTVQISEAEIMSAIYRQTRENAITARTAETARLLVRRHMRSSYFVIEVNTAIIVQAVDLLKRYSLRAYDAIQLAAALEANSRLIAAGSTPLIFVSADQRLLDAALDKGFITENPNLYP